MPNGGSQSPITMRLNLLASRRVRTPALRSNIEARLLDRTVSVVEIATSPLDGTVIAINAREQEHVGGWPVQQLEVLRTIVLTAILQERPTFYDWQYEDADPGITVRDNGDGVFITFRSRPDV